MVSDSKRINDDDDDDDELFLWYGWPTKDVELDFQPAPLSDSHHPESPRRDLNLCRTWLHDLLNEMVATTPWRQ